MTDERLCPLLHRDHPDRPSRSAPGSILCKGHIAKTLHALTDLPARYDELATVAAPSGQSSQGSRSAETPIPYRGNAADLRYGGQDRTGNPWDQLGIREAVISWARNIAEDREVQLPVRLQRHTVGPQCWLMHCPHPSCRRIAFEAQRVTWDARRTEVDLACEFLRRHHDWSVNQPWADDYATEIGRLAERAWSVLHPSGARRITCGPCTEVMGETPCEGVITAVVRDHDDLLPSELSCDLCGHNVTADRWLAYGRRVHESGVATLLAPAYARLVRRIAG